MRDEDVVDEDQEMSITDEDIIRITASEGIPARRVKALEFTRQASSFLLSEDFMNKFFRRFTETAFRHDPTSSFSQIFLPRKDVSEKFEDVQQTLIPVQQREKQRKEKEKEKRKEKEKKKKKKKKRKRKKEKKKKRTRGVKPSKQVGPEKDEAAAKKQNKGNNFRGRHRTGFCQARILSNRLDRHKEICIERGYTFNGSKGHGYASDI
ncbi:hypothetical protein DUI87_00947 [Hirundo rustica rustica]|uniref:Uncharacterized protein n=1 Tax=Hirundo rustica rustica TaxID=333673 RepID=A0A3M0L4Y5_HIRRU|nr:hypothetical protein DUI87_00947 [Hirundo rustica rustica]